MKTKNKLFLIIVSLIFVSCLTKKGFICSPGPSLSLILTEDSSFEYLYYYNNCDTAFLHYSKGKYEVIGKGVYSLTSDSFNNTTLPVSIHTHKTNEYSDSLRIKLKTSMSDDLAPELITTLSLDSLMIQTNKTVLDTIIKKIEFKKITVTTKVIKNTGMPVFDYLVLQSKDYYLDSCLFNNIVISFPIYDYLLNYVMLDGQKIIKKSKSYLIQTESRTFKVPKKDNIYRWWN